MPLLPSSVSPLSRVQRASSLGRMKRAYSCVPLGSNPKSFLFAIIGAEYVLGLLPKGTHEYARFIRPSELARWTRESGLTLEGSKGMEYNPLTRRYRLSGDTSVNYLFACRRPA